MDRDSPANAFRSARDHQVARGPTRNLRQGSRASVTSSRFPLAAAPYFADELICENHCAHLQRSSSPARRFLRRLNYKQIIERVSYIAQGGGTSRQLVAAPIFYESDPAPESISALVEHLVTSVYP